MIRYVAGQRGKAVWRAKSVTTVHVPQRGMSQYSIRSVTQSVKHHGPRRSSSGLRQLPVFGVRNRKEISTWTGRRRTRLRCLKNRRLDYDSNFAATEERPPSRLGHATSRVGFYHIQCIHLAPTNYRRNRSQFHVQSVHSVLRPRRITQPSM